MNNFQKQLLGSESNFVDMDKDNFTIKREQIITDSFIQDLRDNRFGSKNISEGETMRVASIPVVIHEKWLAEGFDLFKEKHKTVVAKLKAEGLDYFVATDKQL